MKFKIGDRVRVIDNGRISCGERGTIIRRPTPYDLIERDWIVDIDKSSKINYSRIFGFYEHQLELDKNQVVLNIINDL